MGAIWFTIGFLLGVGFCFLLSIAYQAGAKDKNDKKEAD